MWTLQKLFTLLLSCMGPPRTWPWTHWTWTLHHVLDDVWCFNRHKLNSHHIVSLNHITCIIFNTCCAGTCNLLLTVSWFFIVFSRDMPASARHLGYFLSCIRRCPIFTHHQLFPCHIVSLNFVTFVNYVICCPVIHHKQCRSFLFFSVHSVGRHGRHPMASPAWQDPQTCCGQRSCLTLLCVLSVLSVSSDSPASSALSV